MKDFKTFIEEKQNNTIKTVLIITEKNFELNIDGKHYTVNRIEEECKKLIISCHVIFIDSYFINESDSDNIEMTIYDFEDNEKKIKFNKYTTIVIVRGNIIEDDYGESILAFLKSIDIPIYNNAEVIKNCSNKYLTYLKLKENNILTPKTTIVTHEISIPEAVKKIGNKFPVIVKTLTGAEGIGITKANDIESLKSMLQAFWKMEAKILIQEYIKHDNDVRVIVINDKIIASMKRIAPKDDFRSNKSIGADMKEYKLDDKEMKIILQVNEMIGGYFLGIDFIKKDNKIYLIEINSSSGTEGISSTTKINIVKILLKNLIGEKNVKEM